MRNKKENLILISGLAFERASKPCGLIWLEHREKREERSYQDEKKNVVCNY